MSTRRHRIPIQPSPLSPVEIRRTLAPDCAVEESLPEHLSGWKSDEFAAGWWQGVAGSVVLLAIVAVAVGVTSRLLASLPGF